MNIKLIFKILFVLSLSTKSFSLHNSFGDSISYKFNKGIKIVKFSKKPPFSEEMILVDTLLLESGFCETYVPNESNATKLIEVNLLYYNIPIDIRPDAFNIREYFDALTDSTVYANPGITIKLLNIDGMSKTPHVIMKLENYQINGIRKKVSSFWFGLRIEREVYYASFIFKGNKLDKKTEEEFINYFKSFEIVEVK